jgi:hypothetical protein
MRQDSNPQPIDRESSSLTIDRTDAPGVTVVVADSVLKLGKNLTFFLQSDFNFVVNVVVASIDT